MSQSLFKYTSIDRCSIQNLEQNQIYFNHHSNFNDIFDMTHEIHIDNISEQSLLKLYINSYSSPKLTEKLLNGSINKEELLLFFKENSVKFFKPNPLKNNNISKFINEISKIKNENELTNVVDIIKQRIKSTTQQSINQHIFKLKENVSSMGVSCFTKKNNNLLMWAHYTDKHKGICLEFDTSDKLFTTPFKVRYNSQIPIFNPDFICSDNINFNYIKEFLCYKSEDWKYEEEYRIFKEDANKAYNYKPDKLKAIYFGFNTSCFDPYKARVIF